MVSDFSYTLLEEDSGSKIKITKGTKSLVLNRESLEKALKILNAVEGIYNQENQKKYLTNIRQGVDQAYTPVPEAQSSTSDALEVGGQTSHQTPTPKPTTGRPVRENKVDVKRAQSFLKRLTKINKKYHEEELEKKEVDGISEVAIRRAIKACLPDTNKETFKAALVRGVGIIPERFDIIFSDATRVEKIEEGDDE